MSFNIPGLNIDDRIKGAIGAIVALVAVVASSLFGFIDGSDSSSGSSSESPSRVMPTSLTAYPEIQE